MSYAYDYDIFETDTLPSAESVTRRSTHFKYATPPFHAPSTPGQIVIDIPKLYPSGPPYFARAFEYFEKFRNVAIVGTGCVGGLPSRHLQTNLLLLDTSQNASTFTTVIYPHHGLTSGSTTNETANTFSISMVALNPSHTLESEPLTTIVVGNPDPLKGYAKFAAPNWDGYGAEPISAETRASARKFLSVLPMTFGAPEIAPGSNGTIALEWSFVNRPLRKLFIDIGPGALWSTYWRKATGEKTTLPHKPIHAGTEDALKKLFEELNK